MADTVLKTVKLSEIVVDDALQSRATLDMATIEQYQADMEAGDKFPPLGVCWDCEAGKHWLYSGFHRYRAMVNIGREEAEVEVSAGAKSSAILLAAGENHGHGRPRTNADKRRAVTMLVEHPRWRDRSDRWIAEQCRVDHKTVKDVRGDSKPEKVTGKDGKNRPGKSSQLGKSPVADEAADIQTIESLGNATPPEKLPPREPVEEQDAPKVVPADLPGHLRDVFADPDLGNLIHQLATLNDQASAIAKRIGRWIKGKSMAYVPWFRTEQALDQAAELARPAELLLATMNAAQPDKPCVACGGDLKGCPECHRTGWMPAWKVREMTRGVA